MSLVAQLIWLIAALAAFGLALVLASCRSVVKTPAMPPPTPPSRFGIVGATGSMEKAFSAFDLVELEPVPFAEIQVGDVVLRRIGAYREVMHRVIYLGVAGDGNRFAVTRGDNVPRSDPGFMDSSDYLGRIRLVKKAAQ